MIRYVSRLLKPGGVRESLALRRRRSLLQRGIASLRPLNIVIGAGPTKFDGWLETDREVLDITSADNWRSLFKPASIDRILAEHVFEHLDESECRAALGGCRRYLKPNGLLRLAVPDGFHPDPEYLDHVRPGGTGPDAEAHKILYTYQILTRVAAQANFNVSLLEYFDESGHFHQQSWDPADGLIVRSADHDERNKVRPLSYTSLIADLRPNK